MKKKAAVFTLIFFSFYVLPVFATELNFPDYKETISKQPQYAGFGIGGEQSLEQKVSDDFKKQTQTGTSDPDAYINVHQEECHGDCGMELEGILIISGIVVVCTVGFVLMLNLLTGGSKVESKAGISF